MSSVIEVMMSVIRLQKLSSFLPNFAALKFKHINYETDK